MIFTFYSYKGGVGRSMALANVAECLYQRGARILIVDWDLEAPGLEHFFYSSDDAQIEKVRSHLGVIDMLLDYQRQCSLASLSGSKSARGDVGEDKKQALKDGIFALVKPQLLPLESYLFPIHPPDSKTDRQSRGLWLLPAGWRATRKPGGDADDSKDERFSKYAQAVQSFDWADLYCNFEGQAYFEWLRSQFRSLPRSFEPTDPTGGSPLGFDAVLIDSRTGVSEMGGVCTRQLADLVVSFCAPNYQNLDGVVRMTKSFLRKDIEEFRDGNKLDVVVVPSRVDLAGETTAQNRVRAQFEERLKPPDLFQRLNLKMWDEMLIPYIVRYAYDEGLAVGDPDANKTLQDAYWRFASRLVLFSEKNSRLREFFAPELSQITRLFPEAANEDTSAVEEIVLRASSTQAGFTSEERAAALRIFTRLVRVTTEPSGDTRLRVKLNELKVEGELVLSKLVAAGILKTQRDDLSREQTVELVHDILLHQWPVLSDWLNQHREFLLWRLRLNASISTWEQEGRDTEFLLRGKALAEARRRSVERPADLSLIEHTFIGASARKRRRFFLVALEAVSVLALGIVGWGIWSFLNATRFQVDVPVYQKPPEQLVRVEQGWTDYQRIQFHHTAPGTRLFPYDWFTALEQPCWSLFGCDMFAKETYLARFGFLSGKRDSKLNPDGLPIGFSRQEDFYDPDTRTTYPVVGLTCAACHTGELHYGKYAVQVDGAPAMIEVTEFQEALGLATGFTKLVPFRYGRFEKRVLGPNPSEERKADLKRRFDAFLDSAKFELNNAGPGKGIYDNRAGFDRTDALTRIGNQVFAVDMKNAANFAPANAPVRFPQIWDASWFDYLQYNSSISDPVARDVGEVLGVRAVAKLYGPDAKDFGNTVRMEGLKELERLLSGPAPFQGLRPPNWPSVFPALNEKKIARGAELYRSLCQSCHLPPVDELLADLKSSHPTYWRQKSEGRPLLKLTEVKVDYLGTDPREAKDFLNRTANTGDLGKGRVSARTGLELVTDGIINKFLNGLSPQQAIQWRGNSDPSPAVRSEPVYKARPLDGIWAVAPYLHNGSVPNLFGLLSPLNERPDKFWTGSKEFDPVKVGYDTSEFNGASLYDVTKPGNSNRGHEFKDAPRGNGVVGPALSPDDRFAIIEYLKSL